MRDLLHARHRLLFVQIAASILHHIEENKVSVGRTSLCDCLLKGGGRVPLLDQGNQDKLLKGGGRGPRLDQGRPE